MLIQFRFKNFKSFKDDIVILDYDFMVKLLDKYIADNNLLV